MSQISDSKLRNPWRDILLGEQASFRQVMFHVENGGRSSGRRAVVHEYPKRNDPYAEDMGRIARRFQFAGYLIYRPTNPNYVYTVQRKLLYEALEGDDAATLVHPVFAPGGILAMCIQFSMTESRDRGGYTQFDMQFVEAGKPVSLLGVSQNTASVVDQQAAAVETNIATPTLTGTIRDVPRDSTGAVILPAPASP